MAVKRRCPFCHTGCLVCGGTGWLSFRAYKAFRAVHVRHWFGK